VDTIVSFIDCDIYRRIDMFTPDIDSIIVKILVINLNKLLFIYIYSFLLILLRHYSSIQARIFSVILL
jgi:hypothetical protein